MLSQSVVILEEKTAEFNNVMESLNGMVEKFNAMMKTAKPPEVSKPQEPAPKDLAFMIPSLKSEPVEEKRMESKPLTMNIKFGPALQSVNTALDSRKEEPLIEIKTEEKKKEEEERLETKQQPSHQSSFQSEILSSQGDEEVEDP